MLLEVFPYTSQLCILYLFIEIKINGGEWTENFYTFFLESSLKYLSTLHSAVILFNGL
jgi:hypothetical protein